MRLGPHGRSREDWTTTTQCRKCSSGRNRDNSGLMPERHETWSGNFLSLGRFRLIAEKLGCHHFKQNAVWIANYFYVLSIPRKTPTADMTPTAVHSCGQAYPLHTLWGDSLVQLCLIWIWAAFPLEKPLIRLIIWSSSPLDRFDGGLRPWDVQNEI